MFGYVYVLRNKAVSHERGSLHKVLKAKHPCGVDDVIGKIILDSEQDSFIKDYEIILGGEFVVKNSAEKGISIK